MDMIMEDKSGLKFLNYTILWHRLAIDTRVLLHPSQFFAGEKLVHFVMYVLSHYSCLKVSSKVLESR